MKAILSMSAAVLLMTVCSRPCLAIQENELVSKERAKELGVTLRSHLDGVNGVKVWVEFTPEGELKEFSRVELRMELSEKCVVDAPLQTSLSAGRVAGQKRLSAYFSAHPEYLAASTVTIIVPAELGRIGYQFQVQDFINLEKYQEIFPEK